MTVITASPKNFSRLLELQEVANENLHTMRRILEEAQMANMASLVSPQSSEEKQEKASEESIDLQEQALEEQRKMVQLFKEQQENARRQAEQLASMVDNFKLIRSPLDKMKDGIEKFKDSLSLENLKDSLLKTVNVGGVLNKKIATNQFIKQQRALGSEKSEAELKQDYKMAASLAKNIQANELQIKKLEELTGLSIDKMKDTPRARELLDKRMSMTDQYKGLDLRVTTGSDFSKTPYTPKSITPTTPTGAYASQGEQMEAAEESARQIARQIELLEIIAQNTGGDQSEKVKPKTEGSQSALGNIFGALGDGLMTAMKALFNPKNLLKILTKVIAPVMIIGSIVNGIIDGFKAWKETGSIKEALIAGIGGILEFLSFGLFDADTVRNIIDTVSTFVNDYIIAPVMDFAQKIGQLFNDYIATPISDAFTKVKGFFSQMFDSVLSVLKSIEIPGVSIKLPLKDDPIKIGPWRPFESLGGSKNTPEAAQSSSAETVYSASKTNADEAAKAEKPSGGNTTVVNAPVTNSSNQTNVIRSSPTNNDYTFREWTAGRTNQVSRRYGY